MKDQKLNCISPLNWIKAEYVVTGVCSLLPTSLQSSLRALRLSWRPAVIPSVNEDTQNFAQMMK